MLEPLALLPYLMARDDGHHPIHLRLMAKRADQAVVLRWHRVPPEVHSLALTIKDTNQKHPHYYGIFYNLPNTLTHLNVSPSFAIAMKDSGVNSWGEKTLHDLSGKKNLVITLYALDKRFSARYTMTGEQLEKHAKGHVLLQSQRLV